MNLQRGIWPLWEAALAEPLQLRVVMCRSSFRSAQEVHDAVF